MYVRKQIRSLGKLYTIYEEVPENFLDETDVENYFYFNNLDIAVTDNRIVQVSESCNKKVFAFKLFQICSLKKQRFILKEEVSVFVREFASILNTLRRFLKQNDKTVKFPVLYPLPKQKQEIGFTLFKDEFFAQYFQDIKEHCNKQIRLSDGHGFPFVLTVTRSVVSPSKSSKLLLSRTFYRAYQSTTLRSA